GSTSTPWKTRTAPLSSTVSAGRGRDDAGRAFESAAASTIAAMHGMAARRPPGGTAGSGFIGTPSYAPARGAQIVQGARQAPQTVRQRRRGAAEADPDEAGRFEEAAGDHQGVVAQPQVACEAIGVDARGKAREQDVPARREVRVQARLPREETLHALEIGGEDGARATPDGCEISQRGQGHPVAGRNTVDPEQVVDLPGPGD